MRPLAGWLVVVECVVLGAFIDPVAPYAKV